MKTLADLPAASHPEGTPSIARNPEAARYAAIAFTAEGIDPLSIRADADAADCEWHRLFYAALADAMDALAAEGVTPAGAMAMIRASETAR